VRPPTIWERITGWFGYLPVRLAYRIVWLTARLGGRTARAIEEAMWDAGIGVPCPPTRDPNAVWEPRYTADEWRSVVGKLSA
jgi:hypothetical protein